MKSILSLAALAALALAACTAPTTDASSDPSSEDEIRSAKVHSDGYFQLRRDLRKCVSPVCGGVFVQLVNTNTTCVDGKSAKECYVASLDLKALGLPAALEEQIASGGDTVIVKAQLVDKTAGTFGNLGNLKVSEAWIAPASPASSAPTEGVKFFRPQHEPLFCVTAPCPDLYTEFTLNTRAPLLTVDEVSLAGAGGSDEQKLAAQANLRSSEGVLVLGRNVFVAQQGKSAILMASQYFTKATAPVKIDLSGNWGSQQGRADLRGKGATATIGFDCGSATIDAIVPGSNGAFTATGTHLFGTGVQPPPGLEPKPVAATYRGQITGKHLTLDMTFGTSTKTLEFEKDLAVQLFRCL